MNYKSRHKRHKQNPKKGKKPQQQQRQQTSTYVCGSEHPLALCTKLNCNPGQQQRRGRLSGGGDGVISGGLAQVGGAKPHVGLGCRHA